MKRLWQAIGGLCLGLLVALSWTSLGQATVDSTLSLGIQIYPSIVGESTRYIGACEGNVNFDRADFEDLHINTYRIYGGMSRWETEDDDHQYGSPTIAEIKVNPNVINWAWWDHVMTDPAYGSDYWNSGFPDEIWQGNARTIFETLKQDHIRPVLTIRTTDSSWDPDWALQLNPPRTEEDWNEWWEHVFATVYWLNVRNDYQVDEFEIHNEPNNLDQGWGGTQEDYYRLVEVAQDAIAHVYNTYLPDRPYHIHAPVTTGGSHWVYDVLHTIPEYFDSVNIHNYSEDVSVYTQRVHRWMNDTIHAHSPLWVGEWGTYTEGYDDLDFSLELIKNLIRMSQPGDNHVFGSHIFSLYDWGREGGFAGLIDAEGNRRFSYYAFRMGLRALQGGRPTFLTAMSEPDLLAIATQDTDENLYVLIVNDHLETYTTDLDLSHFFTTGQAEVWEFSQQIQDEPIATQDVVAGHIQWTIPAQSAGLVKVHA